MTNILIQHSMFILALYSQGTTPCTCLHKSWYDQPTCNQDSQELIALHMQDRPKLQWRHKPIVHKLKQDLTMKAQFTQIGFRTSIWVCQKWVCQNYYHYSDYYYSLHTDELIWIQWIMWIMYYCRICSATCVVYTGIWLHILLFCGV